MDPQKQLVIKLTSFRYKKEGISWKKFHEYGARQHAPKAARIQERHGAYKITHVSFFSKLSVSISLDPNMIFPH